MAPLAVRVGDTTIASGEGRTVTLPLSPRGSDTRDVDALPVFVTVGRRAGPRIVILAAPRGFETQATRVALSVIKRLSPEGLMGSVVVVPVLRPGGRFASGGRPVKRSMEWRLPGDPAGARPARDAAKVFTELVAEASVVLVLSEPDPGRAGTLFLRANLDDPRARRLAEDARIDLLVHARLPTGWRPELTRLEFSIPSTADATEEAVVAIGRLLPLAEPWTPGPLPRVTDRRASTFRRVTPLLAPVGGILDAVALPGEVVAKGVVVARITPPLTGAVRPILAPHDSLILESPVRGGARQGAKLFELGRLPGGVVRHRSVSAPPSNLRHATPRLEVVAQGLGTNAAPLRLGWVERVALPSLGVTPLLAKIDTGARTSALHVTRMKTVETGGLARRSVLEITIPGGLNGARTASVVRVQVREWAQVKDSSGRTERRPVIETTLQIGPLERRIRLTLTDRGDMLYPMLVGRTALGNGVVVDPARRRLWRETRAPSNGAPGRPKKREKDGEKSREKDGGKHGDKGGGHRESKAGKKEAISSRRPVDPLA